MLSEEIIARWLSAPGDRFLARLGATANLSGRSIIYRMKVKIATDSGDTRVGDVSKLWESHRDYLKRVLIALTRDLDLADDLLQETYLRASQGFSGYRGGDGRAWLLTIAKNLFYEHLRKRYLLSETHIRPEDDVADALVDHDLQIDIRQAIDQLDPTSRAALLMKHYGGFTYKDIAERLSCPVGTAKWRVSAALDRLRVALGVTEVLTGMKCSQLDGAKLLDHVSGALSASQTNRSKPIWRCVPVARNG